jgi:hypothetical protein
LSAGFAESFTPTSEIIDEPASDKLFMASAVTEILPEIIPAKYFAIASIILTIIPVTLPKVP